MSQENVEVVRWAFAYEVYGRGDRAEATTYFAPDFVMSPIEEVRSTGWNRFETTSSTGRAPGRTSR